MMKRLFLLACSTCLTAGLLPASVLAADAPLAQTTSTPAIAEPSAPLVQYLKVDAIKTGQKLAAQAADRPTSILSPLGSIVMTTSSSLEFLRTGYWKATVGKYHFALRDTAPKRFRLISQKARLTTTGAIFNLQVAADGVMRVEVLSGSVVLSRANGAYPVTVKAGFKATSGIGRTAKPTAATGYDRWYADIPASSDLLEESWVLAKAATRYERDCTVTTISAMPTQQLTPEEAAALEGFNRGLEAFKVKTVDSYQLAQSLLSTAKEKTTELQKFGGKLYFDGSWLYYPAAATGTWSKFPDKEFNNYMFKLAREKDMAYDFDKPSFKFAEWMERGQNRFAVFEGSLSPEASDALIKNSISQNMPPTQELAKSRIFLAETGGQPWIKYDNSIKVYSGKVLFTLVETCNLRYGTSVNIKPPAAKEVAPEIGRQEMQAVVESVR